MKKIKEEVKKGALKKKSVVMIRTPKKEKANSEFGRGLVVCLVKFRGHFENEMFSRAMFCARTVKNKSKKVMKEMAEGTADSSNTYDRSLMDYWNFFYSMANLSSGGDFEKQIHREFAMFMNGASDHMYEIKVPKTWEGSDIENKILKVQKISLDMGHGIRGMLGTGKKITADEIDKLRDLTDEIILEVDKKLGIKDADFGQW